MIIFAFPPSKDGPSDLPSIAVPGLLSLLTTFDTNGQIQGLNEFPRDVWPPVAATFSTYHLMVGLGDADAARDGAGSVRLVARPPGTLAMVARWPLS